MSQYAFKSSPTIGISDGDTVTVIDTSNKQAKIRISVFDAPEKT